MREPTYFLLAALLDGPQHGYAAAQRAVELSGGRVRLSAGTLYGALERLGREGLVAEEREELVRGRRRRYYRVTDDGAARLKQEAARMHHSAAVVRRALKAQPA